MNTTMPTANRAGPELERGETLVSSLRALPRAAWILFFGTFLNKFGGFVVPFLTLYLTSRGYTVSQTSFAVAAYGVGSLLASLLGGHLADIVQPGQRITAFAALRVSFNAGFAFGPATAGLLAGYGYFWLFAGDAATSALFGLVVLLALPRAGYNPQNHASWKEALRVLRQDRKLHQLLLANFSIALVFFQLASSFGLYVTHLGYSAATYGAVVSLNGALIVFFELGLTRFTRRFPPRRVMAVGYVLCAAGFALNALARSVVGLVACMLVFTLGEMIAMPTSSAYLADLAPQHMRGRYMGASGLTWALALITGPACGLKLFASSPAMYWAGCAALGVFAAAVISCPPRAGAAEVRT